VVTTSFPRWPGDFSGVFILELLKRLTDSFNIFVLAPHFPKSAFKETWFGLTIYRFRYFLPTKRQEVCYGPGILSNLNRNRLLIFILPFLFISQSLKIIYLIKKENIDLVHAHWFLPSGLTASLATKIYQRPLIVTSHGPDILSLKGVFFDKIRSIVFNRAEAITFISPIFIRQFIKNQPIKLNKVYSISMGVDTNLFQSSAKIKEDGEARLREKLGFYPSPPILLFVGALAERKGVSYLVKSMPAIIKNFPKAALLIIGSGPEREELENLSLNLNLKKNVFFLGNIEPQELPYYYNQADVFVLPSLVEGLPVVLMEALACGLPIVATRIAGIPDMIKDGQNGFLVSPQSPKELSRAVINILLNGELRKNIAKEAQKTAREKYDWSVIVEQFKLLYQNTL